MSERLGLTRVAFACRTTDDIAARQSHFTHGNGAQAYILLTSARTPRRDLSGGALFWILKHTLVARQAILLIEELSGPERSIAGIRLSPEIIPVAPTHCRAHQGWRYIAEQNWPPDQGEGDALPPDLAAELAGLALI